MYCILSVFLYPRTVLSKGIALFSAEIPKDALLYSVYAFPNVAVRYFSSYIAEKRYCQEASYNKLKILGYVCFAPLPLGITRMEAAVMGAVLDAVSPVLHFPSFLRPLMQWAPDPYVSAPKIRLRPVLYSG